MSLNSSSSTTSTGQKRLFWVDFCVNCFLLKLSEIAKLLLTVINKLASYPTHLGTKFSLLNKIANLVIELNFFVIYNLFNDKFDL